MGIPLHVARIAGAWPHQFAQPAPSPRQPRRDRSRRSSVARILHPLHPLHPPVAPTRPAPIAEPNRLGTKPARHA